jgi:hypothetical protein
MMPKNPCRAPEHNWLTAHPKDITSLAVTILLCLPSVLSGAALLMNSLLYENIEQWKDGSSALVALGVIVGSPFVAIAAIVGGITTLSSSVSGSVKRVELFVVCLASIATFCLQSRFGK